MEQYLKKAHAWADEHGSELKQLLIDLCGIPAPSNHEELRAEFCRNWLAEAGSKEVHIDEALNVVCPIGDDGGDLTVIMAHTDTVFPDMEPMPLREEDGKIFCPAVGDDTANLAVLMMSAKYMLEQGLGKNLLIVCNSGEEGLGNLKGTRKIMENYGGRVKEFISFDGGVSSVCVKAVGSARYRVEVLTEGGHSYGAFGNRNAIRVLSSMIDTLYTIKVPAFGRTTYNVGTISGGTSVNTIAQQAEMLYEYRSDEREGLAFMEKAFNAVVEAYRATGVTVNVETVGIRPCNGDIDKEAHEALIRKVSAVMKDVTGIEPGRGSGSTDANIPLSMGIPAVTNGAIVGGKAHTREEFLVEESLYPGLKIGLGTLLLYA
ncbi:MAG: M20/M25/M40 family metallo-hydrolase [Oscillospiraceae bacterium]|nr:M20/M25/M40 family metallo-hydrolase [Oscillospiraceae bacterium]